MSILDPRARRTNDDKEFVSIANKQRVKQYIRPYVQAVHQRGLTFQYSEDATNSWGALCRAITTILDQDETCTSLGDNNNNNNENADESENNEQNNNNAKSSSSSTDYPINNHTAPVRPSTKEGLKEEIQSKGDLIPQHIGQLVRKIIQCGGTTEACEQLDVVRYDKKATLCKLYVICRVGDLDWLFHANQKSPEELQERRRQRRQRRREARRARLEAQGLPVPDDDDENEHNNDENLLFDDTDDSDFSYGELEAGAAERNAQGEDVVIEGNDNGNNNNNNNNNNNDDDDEENEEFSIGPSQEPNQLWFKVDPPEAIWPPYLTILLRETLDGLHAYLQVASPDSTSFYDEDEEMEGRVCDYFEEHISKCFQEVQTRTSQFNKQQQQQNQQSQHQQQNPIASPLTAFLSSPLFPPATTVFPSTTSNNNQQQNASSSSGSLQALILPSPSSQQQHNNRRQREEQNTSSSSSTGAMASVMVNKGKRTRNAPILSKGSRVIMRENKRHATVDVANQKPVGVDDMPPRIPGPVPHWFAASNNNKQGSNSNQPQREGVLYNFLLGGASSNNTDSNSRQQPTIEDRYDDDGFYSPELLQQVSNNKKKNKDSKNNNNNNQTPYYSPEKIIEENASQFGLQAPTTYDPLKRQGTVIDVIQGETPSEDEVVIAWDGNSNTNSHREKTIQRAMAGQIPIFRYNIADVVDVERAADEVFFFPTIESDFLLWRLILVMSCRLCLHQTLPGEETIRAAFVLLRNSNVNPRVRSVAAFLVYRWCLLDVDTQPWMKRPLHFVAALLKNAAYEVNGGDHMSQFRLGMILQRLCSIDQIQHFLSVQGKGPIVCLQLVEFCWMVLSTEHGTAASLEPSILLLTRLVQFKRCLDHLIYLEESHNTPLHMLFRNIVISLPQREKRAIEQSEMRVPAAPDFIPRIDALMSQYYLSRLIVSLPLDVLGSFPASPSFTGYDLKRIASRAKRSCYDANGNTNNTESNNLLLRVSTSTATTYTNDLDLVPIFLNLVSSSNATHPTTTTTFCSRLVSFSSSETNEQSSYKIPFGSDKPFDDPSRHPFAFMLSLLWSELTGATDICKTKPNSASNSNSNDSNIARVLNIATLFVLSPCNRRAAFCELYSPANFVDIIHRRYSLPTTSSNIGMDDDANSTNNNIDNNSPRRSPIPLLWFMATILATNIEDELPDRKLMIACLRVVLLALSPDNCGDKDNEQKSTNSYPPETARIALEYWRRCDGIFVLLNALKWVETQLDDAPASSNPADGINARDVTIASLTLRCILQVIQLSPPPPPSTSTSTTESSSSSSSSSLFAALKNSKLITENKVFERAVFQSLVISSASGNTTRAMNATSLDELATAIFGVSASLLSPRSSSTMNRKIVNRILSYYPSSPQVGILQVLSIMRRGIVDQEVEDATSMKEFELPEVIISRNAVRALVEGYLSSSSFSPRRSSKMISFPNDQQQQQNLPPHSENSSRVLSPSTMAENRVGGSTTTLPQPPSRVSFSNNNLQHQDDAGVMSLSLENMDDLLDDGTKKKNNNKKKSSSKKTPLDKMVSAFVYSSLEKSTRNEEEEVEEDDDDDDDDTNSDQSLHDDDDASIGTMTTRTHQHHHHNNKSRRVDRDGNRNEDDADDNEEDETSSQQATRNNAIMNKNQHHPISHVPMVSDFKNTIRYPPSYPSSSSSTGTTNFFNHHLQHLHSTRQSLKSNSYAFLPPRPSNSVFQKTTSTSRSYYMQHHNHQSPQDGYITSSSFRLLPALNHSNFSIHYSGEYPNDDGLQTSVARVFDNGELLLVGSHAGEMAVVGNLSTVRDCCMDDELGWMPMLNDDTDITDIDYWNPRTSNNNDQQQPLLAVGSDRFVRIMRLSDELNNGSDVYMHESLQQFNLSSHDGILGSTRISNDGRFLSVSCRHATQELIMLDIERGIDRPEAVQRLSSSNNNSSLRWVPSAWKNATPTFCSFANHRVNSSEIFLHRGALYDRRAGSLSSMRLDRTDFHNHSIFHPLDVNDTTCISGRFVWDLRMSKNGNQPLVEIAAAENSVVHFAHGGRLIITGFRPEGGTAVPVTLVESTLQSNYETIATMSLHGSPMEISVSGHTLCVLGDAVSPDINLFGLYGDPSQEDKLLFAKQSSSSGGGGGGGAGGGGGSGNGTGHQSNTGTNNNTNRSITNRGITSSFNGELFAVDDLHQLFSEDEISAFHSRNGNNNNNNDDDDDDAAMMYGRRRGGRHGGGGGRRGGGGGMEEDPDFDSSDDDFETDDDDDEEISDNDEELSEGSSWTADHFSGDEMDEGNDDIEDLYDDEEEEFDDDDDDLEEAEDFSSED